MYIGSLRIWPKTLCQITAPIRSDRAKRGNKDDIMLR